MDKLEQIKQKIQEYQNKSAVSADLKAFATLILSVVKTAKENFDSISKENQQTLDRALAYLEQEHEKLESNVSQATDKVKKDFDIALESVKSLVAELKSIEYRDGVDGKDADEEKIVEDVLAQIKFPEYEVFSLEEKGEDIVKEINALPLEDEYKIDASHIKNLPKSTNISGGGTRFLQYLADTNISNPTDGQVLTYDSTTNLWRNENATGGGTIDGSGSAGTLAFWSDADTLTYDAHLTYDAVNDVLHTHKLAGDATDGLIIESANGTDIGILGAANTANVTWYGNHNFDTVTASRVAQFGASKTLESSTVTTTELGYLSGATSALQTQLNAKQPLDTQLTSLAGLSYTGNAGKFIRVNAGETDFELATASGGLSWGSSVSGTTADGLTLTLSNSSDDGASALKLVGGNTQTNQTTLANLQLGTSGNVQGLLIKGTGSQTGGDVGTGSNALTIWGNTANNSNTAIEIANQTSYTPTLTMYNEGVIYQNPSSDPSFGVLFYQSMGNTTTNAAHQIVGFPTAYGNVKAFLMQASATGTTQVNRTIPYFEITSSRTINGSATKSDNYDQIYIKRDDNTTNASADFTVAGSVAHFQHTSVQTSGTLTDSVDVLKLSQSSVSTGNLINARQGSTSVFTVDKSGNVAIGGTTSAPTFRLLEPSGSGSNYTQFTTQAQGANITYTLPATIGGAGTFLKDVAGDGVLSWATPAGSGDAVTTGGLTQFLGNNNWKVFYSDGSGDVQELALGASGTYLKSNGASSAPSFDTPSGGSGITRTQVTTSGSITLGSTASTDYIYYVAGAHTLSMPSPNNNRYTIKNNHSANITIDTAGTELIEGAASISIAPGESVDVASDTTNWYII